MSISVSLTPRQADVLAKIVALRKLTRSTGMKTTKSQNDLLQVLSATDLAAVAQALAEQQQI